MIRMLVLVAACGSPAKPLAHQTAGDQPATAYRIDKTPGGPELGVIVDLQQPATVPYFTIYLVAEDRAALVPRPDGELAGSCTAQTELSDVARRNGLCDVPVSEGAFVDRINRLPIEDALRVKRSLERSMRFEASGEGGMWQVWPFPHKRDVTAICARPDRAGLSAELCEFYSPQHTTEEMRYFGERDTKLLAKRLNELYGVK